MVRVGRGSFMLIGWVDFDENLTGHGIIKVGIPVKISELYPKAFRSYPQKQISENVYLWSEKSVRIVKHFMGHSTLMLCCEDSKCAKTISAVLFISRHVRENVLNFFFDICFVNWPLQVKEEMATLWRHCFFNCLTILTPDRNMVLKAKMTVWISHTKQWEPLGSKWVVYVKE